MSELIDTYLEYIWKKDGEKFYHYRDSDMEKIWFYSVITERYNNVLSLNKLTGMYNLAVYKDNYRRSEIEDMKILDGVYVERLTDCSDIILIKTTVPEYMCMIAFGANEDELEDIFRNYCILTKSAIKN